MVICHMYQVSALTHHCSLDFYAVSLALFLKLKLCDESFRDDAPGSEATKWLEEYNPQEDSELAKTANELLGTVDDPKFSDSEVGQNMPLSIYLLLHGYSVRTLSCEIKCLGTLLHNLFEVFFP